MNLANLLARRAENSPDATALVFGDRSFTFAELDHLAARAAASLVEMGVEPGDRVALWLPNHPAFATAMYGAWRAGAVVVPLHSELTVPEALHIVGDSGAKVVFAGVPQFERAGDRLSELVGHIVPLIERDELPAFETDAALVEVGEDDLALIAYTSGTSGLPKGAMLTHANLRANIEQMRATPMAPGPTDVTLCVLPLFHIYGLNVVLNLSVDVGAKLVLLERFDPEAALQAVEDHDVTIVAAAPPVYVAWLGLPTATPARFASVRLAISGAAPLPKEILDGFAEKLAVTIWEGYGMTETSPALTSNRMGGVAKPGSIGRPMPRVEIRLVDEDGDDVEDGDPGEIWVRGPNVFGGYWNQPDASKDAFSDGWFRTGDVAVADDDGDLYIVDRRRDLILVSGFNVYPREVEDVLMKHPGVSDAAVVGEPDSYTGEHVRAIVVGPVTPDELTAFAREHLAPYKVPSEIEVVSSIPRNTAGKVLRRELRH